MSISLFDPVTFGNLSLSNRMVMAPLTRARAGDSRIPNDLMVEYYGQRATAGLIVSEATAISAQGYGWHHAPGMYTDAMEEAWKRVTGAVHAKGGKIVLQLWHMGRLSHSSFLNGEMPVSSSAVKADGHTRDASGKKDYEVPRALEASELPGIAEDFAAGAARAIRAGFDGVEIHGANGYLLDQFIRDGVNQRDDAYGGSVENRIRFPLEVVRAVTAAVGSGVTGIRLSPSNPNGGTKDSDPMTTFTTLAEALNPFGLAYVHVMEPSPESGKAFPDTPYVTPSMRKAYRGNLIVNGGYTLPMAEKAIMASAADAVAFGVPFIANPDLVRRFKEGAPLNKPDPATFYSEGARGYTDYKAL